MTGAEMSAKWCEVFRGWEVYAPGTCPGQENSRLWRTASGGHIPDLEAPEALGGLLEDLGRLFWLLRPEEPEGFIAVAHDWRGRGATPNLAVMEAGLKARGIDPDGD